MNGHGSVLTLNDLCGTCEGKGEVVTAEYSDTWANPGEIVCGPCPACDGCGLEDPEVMAWSA